ncbi:MAG: hypothetical protein E7270_09045 [Lachnospiraceae bacterium]|nr:hypothetical protein [Lachnospiraceae bacterium]
MTEWRKLTPEEKEKYKKNKPKEASHAVLGCMMYGWKAIFLVGMVAIIYNLYIAVMEKDFYSLTIVIGIPLLYLFFWKIPDLIFGRLRSDMKDVESDNAFIKDVIVIGVRNEVVRRHVSGEGSGRKFKTNYYATIIHMENGTQIQSEVLTGYYIYNNFVEGMEAYVMYFPGDIVNQMFVVDKDFYGSDKPLD